MSKVAKQTGFIISLMLLAAVATYAQLGLGAIVGTVRDATGGVIPLVEVLAKEVNSGVETTVLTTDTGTYRFLNLPIGTYTLTVSMPGFQTVEMLDQRLISGKVLSADFVLSVGAVTQTITVMADPLAMEDVTSSSTGTTRLEEEIEDLPLQVEGNPRNVLLFVYTLAGVGRSTSLFLNTPTINGVGDSGGFRSTNGVKVDGLVASLSTTQGPSEREGVPIPELIAEYRLVTNQDAENGWDLGATQTLVSKSGTNDFHGNVFEYYRNDKFDARVFTAPEKSLDKQHAFGFVLGGPLVKDKHFFIASYDGFRRTNAPGGLTRTVPTAKMKAGDFSEWLGPQIGTDVLGRPVLQRQIYDPLTTRRTNAPGGFIRDPFEGNVIPANRMSPISTHFQSFYPSPTEPGLEGNWIGSLAAGKTPFNRWSIRTDHVMGNHKLSPFFQYYWRESSRTDALRGFGWLPPEVDLGKPFLGPGGWNVRINHTWLIAPHILFNLRLGIVRRVHLNPANPESLNQGTLAGLTGVLGTGTPNIQPGRYAEMGNFQPHDQAQRQNIPARIDLTWIRGDHEIKFGSEYSLNQPYTILERNTNGSFTFADQGTGLADPNFTQTGLGYASYLLGEVNNAILEAPQNHRWSGDAFAFYVQDRWRASNKLTVNYGLRWDMFRTPRELQDRTSTFDPTIPNPGAGGRLGALSFFGEGEGRNGRSRVIDTRYRNFGPRLGLAYQLDSKTVVRAYYGIQYYPLHNFQFHGVVLQQNGWGARVTPSTTNNGITPAFNWNDGFPDLLPDLPTLDPALLNRGSFTSAVHYINPKENKVGSGQNLGFSVERELPWNLNVRAAYVGNLQHNLWTDHRVGINQMPLSALSLGNLLNADIYSQEAQDAGIPVPFEGFVGSVSQALRPFPQYGNINQINAMVGDSLYHAFQLQAQKRFSEGLHFLLAYTFSKTISTDDINGGGGGPGSTYAPHSDLRHLSKSVSPFMDRAQLFNFSLVYKLPWGRGRRFLADAGKVLDGVVGGWQITATGQYMGGLPIFVTGSQSVPTAGPSYVNRNQGVPIRTNVSCSDYDPNDPNSRYLNIDAFSEPAPFTIGDTRVLPNVRTCGEVNENFSVAKRFQITERLNVQFGADFFNVFNRHGQDYLLSLFGVGVNISDPGTFGRYQNIFPTPPRTIQFNFKLRF